MRLYIGGQMRGLEDFGHALFDEAEEVIRAMGCECFNPARYDREHEVKGEDIRLGLAADMAWILAHSQGMIALENWRNSAGAKAEITLHHALGLPVWELPDFVRFGIQGPKIPPLVPVQVRLRWDAHGNADLEVV